MEWFGSWFISVFQGRWHRPVFLVFLVPLLFVASSLAVFGLPLRLGDFASWLIVATIVFLGIGIWAYITRLPKVPKGKLGIAISLECENDDHARKIGQDFIAALRSSLQADSSSSGLSLVVLPQWAVADINDSASANRYVRKVRAHLIFFGSVRLRTTGGAETHVVHVEGLVLHGPTPRAVQQKLSQQMREVMERRLIIPVDNDALIFEATSAVFDLSARFIIGMAAFVSGAVVLAERHFLHVEQNVNKLGFKGLAAKSLSANTTKNLNNLYAEWLKYLMDLYIKSRDAETLEQVDVVSGKLLARVPKHPRALTSRAICEVVLRGDIDEARRLVSKSPEDDAVRPFNLAFLAGFQGDLKQAEAQYMIASEVALPDVTIPLQCEEFIHLILERYPDRYQLYYCLGMINYNSKEDMVGAARDFRTFVERCPDDRYQKQRDQANQLIDTIENAMTGD